MWQGNVSVVTAWCGLRPSIRRISLRLLHLHTTASLPLPSPQLCSPAGLSAPHLPEQLVRRRPEVGEWRIGEDDVAGGVALRVEAAGAAADHQAYAVGALAVAHLRGEEGGRGGRGWGRGCEAMIHAVCAVGI